MRYATRKEKLIYHDFKPKINIWFTRYKGKFNKITSYQEAWYGGPHFISGYFFMFKILKLFIHIEIRLWKVNLFKNEHK